MSNRMVFVLCLLLIGTVCVQDGICEEESVFIFKEAEDFTPVKGDWKAMPWGTNYYAATAANTFLSRLAYMGGSAQGPVSSAVTEVDVPVTDTYLVLCRYEAVYKFETQFGIRIEQDGQVVFDKIYGARKNPKVWFFGKHYGGPVQPELRLPWGPVENIVWEGNEDKVNLKAGTARITLYKGKQPEPAAKRNIDILMLTNDHKDIKHRVENDPYLPMDGLLTQRGDLYMRVTNNKESDGPILVTALPPYTSTHSPYWIHNRAWEDKVIGNGGVVATGRYVSAAKLGEIEDTQWLQPGQTSPWIEVGSITDALNDCGWFVNVNVKDDKDAKLTPNYTLEFACPDDEGIRETIRVLKNLTEKRVLFAMPGNIKAKREVLLVGEMADSVADMIKGFPEKGKKPELIKFFPSKTYLPEGEAYRLALGLNTFNLKTPDGKFSISPAPHGPRVSMEKRQEWVDKIKDAGFANDILSVILGDEGAPIVARPKEGLSERFRNYLQEQGLEPSDVKDGATDWDEIEYDSGPYDYYYDCFSTGSYSIEPAKTDHPRLFYYSGLFGLMAGRHDYFKSQTDHYSAQFPNAGVTMNNTPHIAFYWPRVGETVLPFRDKSMTMPFGEDYIYQVPVTSQQLFGFVMDGYRLGAEEHDQQIYSYIMPQCPGNRDDNFRRIFYSDIAHGVTMFNLFTLDPPAIEYSENNIHQDCVEMFRAIYDVVHETGLFEDIVYPGKVRKGEVAMLLSTSSELWYGTNIFNCEKQHLWMALKAAQVPVDFLIEEDVAEGELDNYKVLYVCDPCVRTDTSEAIMQWAMKGGQVFATAGAGMQNEFNEPNTVLQGLFGIKPSKLELTDFGGAFFGKEHLPWLDPMDKVKISWTKSLPAMVGQQKFELAFPKKSYADVRKFSSGGPAMVVRELGKGTATYAGFFPGMAYVKPAIPKLPCDRSSAPDAFSHFTPTDVDWKAHKLILEPVRKANVEIPVQCSQPLVEVAWVESADGIAIPLIYWSEEKSIDKLVVRVKNPGEINKVESASETPVDWERDGDDIVVTMTLKIADLIMLRR